MITIFLIQIIFVSFVFCWPKKETQIFEEKKINEIVKKIKYVYEEEGFEIRKDYLGATILYESDIKLFFGYSTFCLSELFKGALIDVIDAEIEGEDNKKGAEITKNIAKKYYPHVKLTIGFSPQDTPRAVRAEILKE
ncbi:MAG: hypothetical protein N3B16_05490 [Candidatus Aminicenantes bacterium]|nr:hypothetical protein [Candidatus Aminicenantes bacterium]